jgi:hypothetical protein
VRPGRYRIACAERTVIQLRTVIMERMLRNDFGNGLRAVLGSGRTRRETRSRSKVAERLAQVSS